MAKSTERPLLNLLSLQLCEGISQDMLTGQIHLNRLCGPVEMPDIPFRYTFAAFAAYSETRSGLHAHFRIVDDGDTLIDQSKLSELRPPDDPLQERTFTAHFTDVEFPNFGSYFVQLWVNGRYIMERRLLFSQAGPLEQV